MVVAAAEGACSVPALLVVVFADYKDRTTSTCLLASSRSSGLSRVGLDLLCTRLDWGPSFSQSSWVVQASVFLL